MTKVDPQALIPVSPSTILPDTVTGIEIYAWAGDSSMPILFCSKDEAVEVQKLSRMSSDAVLKLYVTGESFESYQAYLRGNWNTILSNKELSDATRMSILNEVLRDVMKNAFQGGDVENIVQTTKVLGSGIMKVVADGPVLVGRLYDVLHHDYATFTHSANVACYVSLLARKLGYSVKEQNDIVVGALLHDVGKLQIDERILRKPGKLDEFEFREIQRHPLLGYRQLASRKDLSHDQLMMVYQHHEKLDGSGYPVRLVDNEIHPWGKLCAVVDIFEALTSVRPYRSPMPHKTALTILQKGSGKELDSEMVNAWTQLVLEKESDLT